MAKSVWKTTRAAPRRAHIDRPSLGQVVRQLGIAIVIGFIWLGALIGYLGLVGRQAGASSPPEADSVVVERAPTASPTSAPTDTPAPVPTSTASPTDEPPTTPSNPDPDASQPALVDPSPPATATATTLPSPTPTETLQPATDTPAPAGDPAEAEVVGFAEDVFPIIERRCVKCHGGPKDDGTLRIEEGLKMTSYADILAGSWNGSVIEPGSAEDSYLVEQIVTGEMPKKEPRLLPGEVRLIRAWIDAGAPDN